LDFGGFLLCISIAHTNRLLLLHHFSLILLKTVLLGVCLVIFIINLLLMLCHMLLAYKALVE